MKKKLLIFTTIIIAIFLVNKIYISLKDKVNSNMITKLTGQIYYTKRVDGILNLYKFDTNSQKEQLVYSHKGRGKLKDGDYNDNINDFCYDIKSGDIKFAAMNNGDWSLFSIKKGDKDAKYVSKLGLESSNQLTMIDTDYIKNEVANVKVIKKKGSIYIEKDGQEKCLIKFNGLYDEKFTGYSPIGFSSNGKYFVYLSMGHLTPIGTFIEGIIKGNVGKTYIMDMETGKSARFIDCQRIQWVMN
ncbi:hypothetical protein [Clostridium muellerianum]|uniref:hypothetical protein n=1 Tax=Clostridium muellerianum TaxID=2716538 RepID=UPI00197E2EBC|nr:hypothetical protein [Clostridium muellerianum]